METTFGITTIAKGNINEYFKQKFNERKRKLGSLGTSISSKRSKLSENSKISDAVDKSGEPSVEPQGGEEASENPTQKRKKKSKSKSLDVVNEEDACESTSKPNEDDTSSTKGRRKSVTWGDVEVSFVSKYIKDMADTSSDSVEIDVVAVGHEEAETSSLNKRKKKKDKKNKKDESNVVDETHNHPEPKASKLKNTNEMILSTHINVSDDMKKKKKKKKKNSVFIEQCNAEFAQNLEVTDEVGTGSVKKKWKKSVESLERHEEDKISNDQLDAVAALTPTESKKQKKKKSKVGSDADQVFAMDSAEGRLANENPIPSDHEGQKISKKDKKKKRSAALEENLDNSEIQGETVNSKKKKKLKEEEEKNSETGDPALSLAKLSEEKEKKKKRKMNDEGIVIQTTAENEIAHSPSELKLEKENKKSKKQKQRHTSSEDKEELKSSSVDQNCELSLSALTQERMAKWKERRKSNDKTTKLNSVSEDSETNPKTSTAKLEYNPSRPTHDYNHKRVFTALGYNVKNAVDKKICVQMPPSNFPGSNLDEIAGYGQAIISC